LFLYMMLWAWRFSFYVVFLMLDNAYYLE
jgi:hypothetical protein